MREKQKKTVLSKRLYAVASMVATGSRICDVGCDHGFVPIYLIQQGISPRALAMDVREGPLKQAEAHIRACGLEAYIETRLSDGLCAYRENEADSLICAGMGGKLMMRILKKNEEKAASFKELILQPQSEVQDFRHFLRRQGYLIVDENMIEEDGRFYPMMKAVKSSRSDRRHGSRENRETAVSADTAKLLANAESQQDKSIPQGESSELSWEQRMEDRYGPVLLQKKSPVLCRYLEREKRLCEEVLEQLQTKGSGGARQKKRYEEVEAQLRDCKQVKEGYEGLVW